MDVQITNAIIECIVGVVSALLLGLVGIAMQYLTALVAQKLKFANLSAALGELDAQIETTVKQLQQVLVDDMKEAAADGKLTEEEVKMLGERLVDGVNDRLSKPASDVIKAAGIDINAYIQAQAEAVIHDLKPQNLI